MSSSPSRKGRVRIRDARKEDCPQIIRLIQELADYEKMPDGPKIDAKVLEEDGFGPERFYHCLVSEDEDEANGDLLGYCLYFYTYSTWEGRSVYMEDIYVTPSSRGRGAGVGMWRRMVQIALDRRCSRCNFSVLDWNRPSIDFYRARGAVDLTGKEGWLAFRMDREAMEKFAKEGH